MAPRSRFLELPVELRQQIYSYLFAWPEFPSPNNECKEIQAAYEAKARSLNLICGVCRLDFHKHRDRFADRTTDSRADHHVQLFRFQQDPPRDPTPILRTCRRVYFEAMDCLYHKTLFVFAARHSAYRWQPRIEPWRFIGTTTDIGKGIGGGSAFLKRITNISIHRLIEPGNNGRAVKPLLLLLNDLLNALRPDRRFTEIELKISMRLRWLGHPHYAPGKSHSLTDYDEKGWKEIRSAGEQMKWGCVPDIELKHGRCGVLIVDEEEIQGMEEKLREVLVGGRTGDVI